MKRKRGSAFFLPFDGKTSLYWQRVNDRDKWETGYVVMTNANGKRHHDDEREPETVVLTTVKREAVSF